MPQNITDTSAFTSPVVAPVDGEAANAASLLAALQPLSNRTRYLLNLLEAAAPLTKVIELSLAAAVQSYTGATGDWTISATPRKWVSGTPSRHLYLPLNEYLRDGMVITDAKALVDPAAAQTTDASQMQLNLVYVAPNYGTPAAPSETVVASQLDNEAATIQTISLASALGAGHTVVRASRDYHLRIRGSVVAGDEVWGLQLTVTDPGARNF
jgi:hypothetical protein